MNAINPVPATAGHGDARPYEPSMEEILASIRRIIADDQSLPGRTRAEDSTEGLAASLHKLHTDDAMSEVRRETHPGGQNVDAQHGADAMIQQGSIANPQFPSPTMPSHGSETPVLTDRLEIHNQEARDEGLAGEVATYSEAGDEYDYADEEQEPSLLAQADPAPLFSTTTNSSVASAFNVLAASRLADNSEELLGMARDLIRPLLRTWLDDNLPSMVERLVREEIERVARGR